MKGVERELSREPAKIRMVTIAFTLEILKDSLSASRINLAGFVALLRYNVFGITEFEQHTITFLDGPNEDDKDNTLENVFHFFCTSAGYIPFSQQKQATFRLWILDGWSWEDSLRALRLFNGSSERKAKAAFALYGGSILIMRAACIEGQFETVKRDRDRIINEVPNTHQHAPTMIRSTCFWTTERSEQAFNLPDQLVTMFALRDTPMDESMDAVQYIDSSYVLDCFAKCIDVAAFRGGHELSISIGDGRMQRIFYERVVHAWLTSNASETHPVAGVIRKVQWSTGMGWNGVQQFTERNVFWIPSALNFANVGAGLVENETLHLFQYTVMSDYRFRQSAFEADFLRHVMAQIPGISSVVVHFVTQTPRDEWSGLVGGARFSFQSSTDPNDIVHIDGRFEVNQLDIRGRAIDDACRDFFTNLEW